MSRALRVAVIRCIGWGLVVGSACGCGERIDIPQEPDTSGGTGEIAYVLKYRWDGVPSFSDIVLTRGQVLYGIETHAKEESIRVTAWFSDAATPRQNTSRHLPHPTIIDGAERRRPVQLCEGPGNTLWVAFTLPELALFQFDVGVAPPVYTGLSVRDIQPGILGGIACDRDSGFVYLAETTRNQISKWEPSESGGRFVVTLAPEGNGDGFVREPRGVYFFNDSLLVADTGKSWIQVLSADVPRAGRGEVIGADLVRQPVDVWVDRSGRYYVADTGNNRVVQALPRGTIQEDVTELDAESAALPIAVAATDTQVWVPHPGEHRLTVYQINTIGETP